MDKFFIPKGCVIQGTAVAISNEGDIIIENEFAPQVLNSGRGGIKFIPQRAKTECDKLVAENGLVEVEAQGFKGRQILAQSAHLKTEDLEIVQSLITREDLVVESTNVRIELCQGDKIEIHGENLEIQTIEASSEVTIRAQNTKVHTIRAKRVMVHGSMVCKQVVALENVVMESGHVSIKSLDCPSFHASPDVKGIVMVANSTDVKAEGVRGFIHPSELGMLSGDDAIVSMPSAELSAFAGDSEEKAEPPEEPEPEKTPDIETVDINEDNATGAMTVPAMTLLEEEVGEDTLDQDDQVSEELAAFTPDEPEPEDQDDQAAEELAAFTPDGPELEGQPEELDVFPEIEGSPAEEEAEEDLISEPPTEELSAEELAEFGTFEEPEEEHAAESFDVTTVVMGAVPDDEDNEEPLPDFGDLEDLDELTPDEELDIPADSFEEEEMEDNVDAFDLMDIQQTEEMEEEADELSADDLQVMDEINGEFPQEELTSEEALVRDLTVILRQIRDFFSEDNYPNSINQIYRYIEERRFTLFAKARNRDAVLSSFDKFQHPEISRLARDFFARLDTYFTKLG